MNHDLRRYRWHVYVMEICSQMKFMAASSLIAYIQLKPLRCSLSHKVKGKYLNSRLIQSRLTHNTAPAVKRVRMSEGNFIIEYCKLFGVRWWWWWYKNKHSREQVHGECNEKHGLAIVWALCESNWMNEVHGTCLNEKRIFFCKVLIKSGKCEF